ncbi:hypothetical protein QT21_00105, partial [Staphylococcus aureus]
LARDAGVHLGHFTRLAFQVTQDQRAEAGLARLFRSGLQRLLGAGDQLEVAAGQGRVIGLDGFGGQVVQPRGDGGRGLDVVALEDRQRFGRGARVGHGGAGGDHGGEVAGYVGNRVGVHRGRPAGLGQAAALDRREVLAHAVH